MKIYYFGSHDHSIGLHYAGIKVDGKRSIQMVCRQGQQYYCTTGAKITNDLQRHNFSEAQTKAFQEFLKDGKRTEFWEGIE